jgi:hypothetical protein
MITMCRTSDETDKIRNMSAFDDKGMIETWYVCMALTKLVGESIKVDDYGNGTIQLINRGEFIHTANYTYELTTIKIQTTPRMRPHSCVRTWLPVSSSP